MGSFNIFGGGLIQPAYSSYSSINLSSNISLAWPTDFGNSPYVVSNHMDIYPAGNGYSITLPNAVNVTVGYGFTLYNRSIYSFTLLGNDGITPIAVLTAGSFSDFYLTDNSTQNGSWVLVPNLGVPSVISIGMNATGSASSNISITSDTSNPITLSGTFSLGLIGDLGALSGFGDSIGIATRVSNGDWVLNSILGTNNQITVLNADGVSGSPIIGLASAISGINSIALSAGNLNIGVTPNFIESNDPNGNITIASNGTGSINIVAGSTGNISLSASGGLVSSNTDTILLNNSALLFTDNTGNTISLVAPTTVTTSYNNQLPGSIPSAGQCLGVASVVGNNVFFDWINVSSTSSNTIPNTLAYYTNTSGSNTSTVISTTGDDGSQQHRPTGISIPGILSVGNIILNSTANTINTSSGNLILSPASPGSVVINPLLIIQSGNLILGSDSNNTISTNLGNLNLSPASPASVVINSSAIIQSGNFLTFNNAGNTHSYSLSVGSLSANYVTIFPVNNGNSNYILQTDGNNPANLSWTNTLININSIGFGTNNIVISGTSINTLTSLNPITIGTNSNVAITIDISQNVTFNNNVTINGLLSIANISNPSGILSLSSSGGIYLNSTTSVRSGNSLSFYNSSNTFSYSFQAPSLTNNYTAILPLNNGSSGNVLSTNGSNPASLSWTGVLTNLTSASFGANNLLISGSTIETTTNVNSITLSTNSNPALVISPTQNITISTGNLTLTSGGIILNSSINFGINNLVISGTTIGTTTNTNSLFIQTNSINAISIDPSQNITTSKGITLSSGNISLIGSINLGNNNLVISGTTIGTTTNVNSLFIQTNSINAISIDPSQNITTAKGITLSSGNILVNSGTITASSDIISSGGNVSCQKFISAPNIPSSSITYTFGTNFQNTFGYDIILTIYIDCPGAVTFTINVAPTAIITGQTVAVTRASTVSFPFYIPKNYYCYVQHAGGATIISAQVVPV